MKKILKGLLLAMLAALLAVCAACGSAEVRVKLGTSSVVLRPGETEKLTAELPQGGTAVWKSDDERVALVTQDGMVTAVSVGSAAVSVTCGGSSDYCQITVTEQGQTSVSDEQNKEGTSTMRTSTGGTACPTISAFPARAADTSPWKTGR